MSHRNPAHPLRYIVELCDGYQVRIPPRAGGPQSKFFAGLSEASLFAALCYRDLMFLAADKLVFAVEQVSRCDRSLPVGVSLAIGRPSRYSNRPTKNAYVAYWNQRDRSGRSIQHKKRFSFRDLGARGALQAAAQFRQEMVTRFGQELAAHQGRVQH